MALRDSCLVRNAMHPHALYRYGNEYNSDEFS